MTGIERIAIVRRLEDIAIASWSKAADDDKLLAAAVCLLACTVVKPNAAAIVELTRYPPEFVSFREANWRKSRVWCGEGEETSLVDAAWVGKGQEEATWFWRDVSVGMGWLRRTWDDQQPKDACDRDQS